MATLSQVYTNLGVGAFISTVSYLGFGAAVRTESNSNLTPRAWARPVEVIQNCLSRPYCLGWIPWAMSLRYVDLLAGIPGTGTRKRGWSGPLLKTNLDGIVLLRYHALQFKVSAVSTILCMMILLPLYYTSRCDPLVIGPDFCDQHARLTDFEQLTIANVLPQAKSEIVYTNGTKVEYTNPYYIVYFNQSLDDIDIINSLKIRWSPGITERYLATTFVIAIITIYTCYLLWHEWIQCLALRRVYYLESEYYEERLDELNDIRRNTDPEDPFQKIRPPFLPHPELRETVPNVSLHSVLYKLPSNLRSNFDFDSSGTSGKTPTLLERQLDAAVEFFDQCVPNQSGYTSSIAAISMVPDAKQLTKVWGKWYACGNHLRRLRHLKALLERRREMKQAGQLSLHDILVLAPANIARATLKATTETLDTVKDRAKSQDGDNHDCSSSALVTESAVPGFKTGSTTDQFEYDEFDPVTFAKWLGYSEETELDQLVDTLDIEQLSVFARETAQSASNPCVYGCSPNTLHFFSIEQLEVLVEDTWKAARDANAMLLLARAEMFDEDKTKGAEISKKEQKISQNNDCADAHNDVEITPTVNMARPKSDSSVRFDLKDETNNMPDPPSTNDKKDSSNPLSDPPSNIQGSVFFKSGLRKRGKNKTRAKSTPFLNVLGRRAKKGAVSLTRVLDHPSYCVVTFTSRQAAIAARQCLADGKGTQAWTQIQNIPMHPLADAPPRNPFFCRGCCRPVTLTIPAKEKRTRSIITWALYVLFCLVYTIPLTFASQVLNPTLLAELYPNAEIFQDPDTFFVKALAGISTGYIYTLFFSVLPQIFKLLAFSEGSSSSKAKAEENAMRFYWYFMLVTAFTGQSLVQMFIDGILQGPSLDDIHAMPSFVYAFISFQQAPTWLNWIIVRTGTTLPLNYLLQIMTFVYGWLKIPWLNRVMRGGGPGGPPPYRIYIDSGVVFMCLTSLAPACPIIAPCCLLYYAVFIPMLRWLHVFVYRPFYDGGGNRLPVIHEIIISSLILSQFLLGTVLLLKQCFILGITTSMMSFPTFIFSQWTKEKFERSYNDAGLWQTSKLDGLSNKESMQEREKYRRWLVDVHKASYVPMCLSGGEDFLTNQPAVVVPIERELAGKDEKRSPRHELQREATQKGAIFRRYLDS
eukprot:jgi/Psemu1/253742/estExt_Genewise1Plus.C_770053